MKLTKNPPVSVAVWTAFRQKLLFPCIKEPASDLGHPGVMIVNLDHLRTMIVELRDKGRLPEIEETVRGRTSLSVENFTSPQKVIGADSILAGKARLLESLFDQGMTKTSAKHISPRTKSLIWRLMPHTSDTAASVKDVVETTNRQATERERR